VEVHSFDPVLRLVEFRLDLLVHPVLDCARPHERERPMADLRLVQITFGARVPRLSWIAACRCYSQRCNEGSESAED
jgi:hypothetical protein